MEELKQIIKDFSQARDWEQFHAPKNLAMALSTEAAEILEIYQWKEAAESLTEQELDNLRQEIGDILIYLIELADKYQIDILEAAKMKMQINEGKYPVEKVKGRADKYTKYQ